MILTKEAIKKSGLTEHKFRKMAKALNLSPVKKRGEVSFRWSIEQIEQISVMGKAFFKEKKEASELDIVEYYINNRANINRTANKFNINYYTVYRIIKRYERVKFVEVQSKMCKNDR